MSTIGVTYHNESIYRILYKEPPPRPKSPMYVSEREKKLKCQVSCIPQTYSTMGQPEVTLRAPCQYLRKGEGKPKEVKPQKSCCLEMNKDHNKAKNTDKTKANDKTKKNTVNAKKKADKNKNKKPSRLVYVDAEDGHKSNIIKNKFVYSEGYGKIPEYITSLKTEWKRLEDEYRKELENQEPLCKPVSVEEREKLLDGLKYNQAQIQKEFLLLPMMIDTIPKVMRKTKLEKDILQIEKDVRLIEENPYIYLYD